jgi:hypothetical protein
MTVDVRLHYNVKRKQLKVASPEFHVREGHGINNTPDLISGVNTESVAI